MVDCARAALSLEQASEGLPSAQSLGAIDAVLVYIRARVRDVTLPGTTGKTPAATATPADADERAASDASDADAIVAADAPAQSGPVDEQTATHETVAADADDADDAGRGTGEVAADKTITDTTTHAEAEPEVDDETFDESQYSVETQAIIRTFKNAPLRQRAPGEVAQTLHQPARDQRDMIPEPMRR
jgi:hypothetical protein